MDTPHPANLRNSVLGCSALTIAPQSGAAVVLEAGDRLAITSPTGEQVADLFAFRADDYGERLSSGRTIDYEGSIFVREGSRLYSNRSNVMFFIEEDTAGRHDFLLTPCSQEMFEKLYGVTAHHPSCFENLVRVLVPHGVSPDDIGITLNVFMRVDVNATTGAIDVAMPSSRPGDVLVLRAEMDLLVGVTACSAELTNNGSFKPIDIEVRR
jgi:uncharacterized protein